MHIFKSKDDRKTDYQGKCKVVNTKRILTSIYKVQKVFTIDVYFLEGKRGKMELMNVERSISIL